MELLLNESTAKGLGEALEIGAAETASSDKEAALSELGAADEELPHAAADEQRSGSGSQGGRSSSELQLELFTTLALLRREILLLASAQGKSIQILRTTRSAVNAEPTCDLLIGNTDISRGSCIKLKWICASNYVIIFNK